MSVLIARHGLSQANNHENVGTLAFAAEQAPLMDEGHKQAGKMGRLLLTQFGINPVQVRAATSTLLRSRQTGASAGFLDTIPYAGLDEVKHNLPLLELRTMLDAGKLPTVAIAAAEETLANPPRETVWISHGLRIAALCAVLGVRQDTRLIPRFCEIRELPIEA